MKLGILLKQDLKNLITNPVKVLYCLVYPLFLILLFGFLFSNLYGGESVSSYDFYGVTMLIYIIISSSTITPTVFMEERIKQGNLRIAYSPISRVTIYTSKLLATFLFMFFTYSLDILALNGLGIVNFGGEKVGYVYLLLMTLLFFATTMGGAICTIIKSEDLTNKIIGVVVNTLAICSGIFFPIATLGEFADKASNLSPIKWVLNKVFEIIYDANLTGYIGILLALLAFSILFISIIHRKYKVENYL
ncbi:MAG: ABC transporter permease [Clostridia bacterium]